MLSDGPLAYTNRQGQSFTILPREAPVPEDADYRGYYVICRHEDWGERAFQVFIKKSCAGTRDEAERVLLGPALRDLHRKLDTAGPDGIPMAWPHTWDTLGYAVF